MGATYTGSIELRRLVVKFSRTPTGGIAEDADAFTVHFAKLTGGAVDASWVTGDYTAVESAFDTLWTAIKGFFGTTTKLAGYTWYKDGPVFSPADRGDGPANPAVRTTSRSVAGTSAATMLPPQVALTVTKIVDVRKRWGRLYLPAMFTTEPDANGRSTSSASLCGSFVTCFNSCRAAGKQPVVWSRGRSAYVTSKGTSIAAHDATAYEITTLQMDNLFDVIRSRRWSQPTVRTTTVLT